MQCCTTTAPNFHLLLSTLVCKGLWHVAPSYLSYALAFVYLWRIVTFFSIVGKVLSQKDVGPERFVFHRTRRVNATSRKMKFPECGDHSFAVM